MGPEYDERPNDFSRQIIAEGSTADCRNLEGLLLKKLDAAADPSFYNQNNMSGKYCCTGHTEETKRKICLANIGRRNTQETLDKMRMAQLTRPAMTEETKLKMSISAKRRANSPEGKARLQKIAHLGMKKRVEMGTTKLSEETKENIRVSVVNAWQSGKYETRKPRKEKINAR